MLEKNIAYCKECSDEYICTYTYILYTNLFFSIPVYFLQIVILLQNTTYMCFFVFHRHVIFPSMRNVSRFLFIVLIKRELRFLLILLIIQNRNE